MHSTINGIDLLFAVIGLALLLVVWIGVGAYLDWEEENEYKRRQRMRWRIEMKMMLEEEEYREGLRTWVAIMAFTSGLKKIGYAFDKMTKTCQDVTLNMKLLLSTEDVHEG